MERVEHRPQYTDVVLKIPRAGRYWLFKTEPTSFSFDDLWRAPKRRTQWDGVRNYQARNLLRDEVKIGDGVLIYHSNHKPLSIAGIARVVREGYPDPTAFDPGDHHFDPDSDPDDPTWFMVDIEAVQPFDPPVQRDGLRKVPACSGMMLLQRGARLSVQPVAPQEWAAVLRLAGVAQR
ncbi:MAG: EVE domain-containing protein [Planctomycetes bacterium]|nr:EVE domain-containing protein [Planctomycetota bacterium]